MDRYTAPDSCEWHLAHINNRWTKRALAAAGFGYPNAQLAEGETFKTWKPIFDVSAIGGSSSAAAEANYEENERHLGKQRTHQSATDIGEIDSDGTGSDYKRELNKSKPASRAAVVHGIDKPYFHIDLTSALQSAISSIKHKNSIQQAGGKDAGVLP